ncbi:phosphorylase family protein [Streptomyces phaeochromogenes]|uniref:5'-methylthioadenosine/S-adenosylhomocysteine nucleosidase family protein n=1 Tax=Streptomyces phaeochromogenes TaxID=1923 RepID=UPI0033EAA143
MPGTSWTVYLAATGPGNDSAAVITERAINFVRPQAAFFVGIAGSLKSDVSRGDVVVALEVYAYHGGKESREGFKGRPRSWETSHPLQQVAMYVHSVDDWRGALSEAEGATTKVHFKPIAAGDLVLDAPAESPSRVHLERNFNDAVAVEMEGAGFASPTPPPRRVFPSFWSAGSAIWRMEPSRAPMVLACRKPLRRTLRCS